MRRPQIMRAEHENDEVKANIQFCKCATASLTLENEYTSSLFP